MVSTSNRWLTTIWKASPAWISSTAADGGLELLRRALPADRQRLGRSVAVTTADGVGSASCARHRLEPGDGVGVGLVDALVGGVEVDRVGDQPDLAVVVVEHRQVGGEQEGQLGHVDVVGVAVRQPLDPADGVVAEVADQARGERRQAAGVRGVCSSRRVSRERRQRVAAGGQPGRRVPGQPPGRRLGQRGGARTPMKE